MKPKYRRLRNVLLSLVVMGVGLSGILYAFNDNIVFFYTPSQLTEKKAGLDLTRTMRIGGIVKMGSVKNKKEGGLEFIVTDLNNDIPVRYSGMVPSLFREGQGIVAQGVLGDDGKFTAATILAKHDETYMPREVVEELKKSGRWQETGGYKRREAK